MDDKYTSTILSLPSELTNEIFRHYLPPYPQPPPPCGPRSPVQLLAVCRLWRATALANPLLWRTVPLNLSANAARAWLTRSGSLPLTLGNGFREQCPCPDDDELIAQLTPHRTRWTRLSLSAHAYQAIQMLAHPCPRLVELDFRLHPHLGNTMLSPHRVPRLGPAPALCALRLWTPVFAYDTVPWAQLTTLVVGQVYTPADAAATLPLAGNLVRCKLVLYDAGGAEDRLRLDLPFLEVLVLQQERGMRPPADPTCDYFAAFVLPSLRRMEVAEALLVDGVERVRALVGRSQCRLEAFRIVGADLDMPKGVLAQYRVALPGARVEYVKNDWKRVLDGAAWETDDYWA